MDENDNATATLRLSGVDYIEFLTALHTHLTPRSYLEVGIATEASLAVAGCDTIAVHPRFQSRPAPPATAGARSSFRCPPTISSRPKMRPRCWDGRWIWPS